MRALFSSYKKLHICVLFIFLGLLTEGHTLFAQNSGQDAVPEISVRDANYIRELNNRASDLLNRNQYDSARVFIDEALSLSQLLNDVEGEAHAVNNLTNYYLERGLPDSVVSILEHTFSSYSGTEFEVHLGNHLANAHNMLGNYQEGLELYHQMRNLAEERGETRMAIGITQNIATNYKSLGDIPAALDNYLQSLEMAKEINDTLIIAVVLDNLGSLNMNDGNYEIAEDYLYRALEMNHQINNKGNQITNHMSLGGLYREQGYFEESQKHYNRVLEIAEDIANTLAHIQAIYNLGLLNKEIGELVKALELFEESFELSRVNNIPIGFYFNQQGMAGVYTASGDYERAIELYEAALDLAKRVNATDMIRGTLEDLYQTYELAGDTTGAYTYLKQHAAITDSLSRTNREEALARQEALHGLHAERETRALLEENLQIQQTNTLIASVLLVVIIIALFTVIILLQKKRKANTLLRKRTEELSKVNEIKDRLLSVLAHDLRTPLSNIQGVVYMIREELLEKKDIEKALSQIDAQLQQDINTLTNYLQWAQTQQDGITANLEDVSLSEIANNTLLEINRGANNKGVTLINKVPDDIYAVADKQMMTIILRNLLSNAVKFVGEGDQIIVETKQADSYIDISVQDTGRGIDPDARDKLFKPFNYIRKGTAGEIGTGLGLSICKEFTEEQGGSISFESEPGKGTTFSVRLQKATAEEPVSESV